MNKDKNPVVETETKEEDKNYKALYEEAKAEADKQREIKKSATTELNSTKKEKKELDKRMEDYLNKQELKEQEVADEKITTLYGKDNLERASKMTSIGMSEPEIKSALGLQGSKDTSNIDKTPETLVPPIKKEDGADERTKEEIDYEQSKINAHNELNS